MTTANKPSIDENPTAAFRSKVPARAKDFAGKAAQTSNDAVKAVAEVPATEPVAAVPPAPVPAARTIQAPATQPGTSVAADPFEKQRRPRELQRRAFREKLAVADEDTLLPVKIRLRPSEIAALDADLDKGCNNERAERIRQIIRGYYGIGDEYDKWQPKRGKRGSTKET